jgi:hypothetical protein
VADHIKTLGQNIAIFLYNLVHRRKKHKDYVSGPGAFSSDAFSGLDERIAEIWAHQSGTATSPTYFSDIGDNIAGMTLGNDFAYDGITYDPSGSPESQPAREMIGRDITLNFYNQDIITREEQLRELATIVREQLMELEALGQ